MLKKNLRKVSSFISKCKRVWHILKKPGREEFISTAKVSAIGILLIGLIGFLISVMFSFFQ